MENEANKNVGDLVEMVARAIHGAVLGNGSDWEKCWTDDVCEFPLVKKHFTDLAQAALSAIRQQSGVKVDDDTVISVSYHGTPTTIKDIREFLGQSLPTQEYQGEQCTTLWSGLAHEYISQLLQYVEKAALRSSEMPNGEGEDK